MAADDSQFVDRPPDQLGGAAAGVGVGEAVEAEAAERPSLALVGTIISPKASVAVLQESNTEAISRLRVGEENDGWQVRGIDLRSIVVVKGGQSVKLDLPSPDGAPAE